MFRNVIVFLSLDIIVLAYSSDHVMYISSEQQIKVVLSVLRYFYRKTN